MSLTLLESRRRSSMTSTHSECTMKDSVRMSSVSTRRERSSSMHKGQKRLEKWEPMRTRIITTITSGRWTLGRTTTWTSSCGICDLILFEFLSLSIYNK